MKPFFKVLRSGVTMSYKVNHILILKKKPFGILFEIEIDVKIDIKQIIQTIGKEGEKVMETKLTEKRVRFLSSVENALEQMLSVSTEADTTINDNEILRDLIRLENNASSGSVSLSGDCDSDGNLSTGDSFIIVDNPMTFAHCLN
jgi:hypothetical protein